MSETLTEEQVEECLRLIKNCEHLIKQMEERRYERLIKIYLALLAFLMGMMIVVALSVEAFA